MQTDYGTYTLNKQEKGIFFVLYAAVSVTVSILFYRTPVFALLAIPLIVPAGRQTASILKERRNRKLLIEFKDMLFMLSTSIGAGRSMKDAIAESLPGIESMHGENSCLLAEMKAIHARMENGNEKDQDVLMDFAIRSGLEDIIDFVTIYSVCKVTGADLITQLNKAAGVIIDKMSIDSEIKEMVRRKEAEGLVIFAMPVIVILFLNLTAPDYIDPLYTTLAGRLIMTGVIASDIAIYRLIKKITVVEV